MEEEWSKEKRLDWITRNISYAEETKEKKVIIYERRQTEEEIFPISLSDSPVEVGESEIGSPEIVKVLSDAQAFRICPDCLLKKPANSDVYEIALKTEDDGTSYSLKILCDFTGASSSQIDLSNVILNITEPVEKSEEKKKSLIGPKTRTETAASKKYFHSRALKTRTLNILYDSSFLNKKVVDRIPFYIDSLQIENVELILNDLPWEMLTMRTLKNHLKEKLPKLVVIDIAFLQLNEFPEVQYRDQFDQTIDRSLYDLCRFTTSLQALYAKVSCEELSRIFFLLKLCFFLQSKKEEDILYYMFTDHHTKLIANATPDFVKFVFDFYMEVDNIKMKTLQRVFDNFKALDSDRILDDCIPEDYEPQSEFIC